MPFKFFFTNTVSNAVQPHSLNSYYKNRNKNICMPFTHYDAFHNNSNHNNGGGDDDDTFSNACKKKHLFRS